MNRQQPSKLHIGANRLSTLRSTIPPFQRAVANRSLQNSTTVLNICEHHPPTPLLGPMSELAFQHQGFGFGRPDDNEMGSSIYPREASANQGPVELLPNPDFVFPARAPATSSTELPNWQRLRSGPQSSTSSAPMASSRRLRPAANALPAFTFNPSESKNLTNTPPHSPALVTPTSPSSPYRTMGHRRGGSEFIGGDVQAGVTGVRSASPTKHDVPLAPPVTSVRLGPPPGRRGHAHRRSGAMSCHDIQSILQPKDANAQQVGGSAPVTPREVEEKPFFPPPGHARRAASQSTLRPSSEQVEDVSQQDQIAQIPRPVGRVRVGFADRVEYIRPLSTISSETESSLSTIRGHSAHNSMNSVLSNGASSPPSARIARPKLDTTFEDATSKPRPQSAGNILDTRTKSKEGFHLLPHFGARPKSAHGTEKDAPSPSESSPAAKRKSFTWWDHKDKSTKSQTSRASPIPSSSSEPSLVTSPESDPSSPSIASPRIDDDVVTLGSPARTSKSPRKPRKVKSWAHSIISRKGKDKALIQKEKLPASEMVPTSPPTEAATTESESIETAALDNFEPDFDDDNTVTIISTETPKRTSYLPDSPRATSFENDTDSASPVIDLDAALGPFNTPPLSGNSRGRRVPPARRSMYSLGANYNNHRRAESAPELPPFDIGGPKKKPSFMEDVFEEENEDENEDEPGDDTSSTYSVRKVSESTSRGDNIPNAPESDIKIKERVDSGPNTVDTNTVEVSTEPELQGTLSLELPTTPALEADVVVQEHGLTPVEVVESYEEPRASTLDRDSDSTITPTLTPDPKESQPLVALGLPAPPRSIVVPEAIGGSNLSTPELGPAHFFEPPRLSTANSSMTDHRYFTIGEPGHEGIRMSVDDVPSLTSSRSTATSPAHHAFARPSSAITHDAQRSPSVFSGNSFAERTRKRSSIASLSRLVGRDRSKLNIESRPQSQHISAPTAEVKEKKSKRLSKLMSFWKPRKGSATSS